MTSLGFVFGPKNQKPGHAAALKSRHAAAPKSPPRHRAEVPNWPPRRA
ncbi:MAG: hypothetical protein LBI02_11925 [Opitutaceae bacterium]|nr:hypothetical protein [Opitutaceae bacterium]